MDTASSTAAPERARWPRLAAVPHPLLESLLPRGYVGFTEATTPRHLVLPATTSVPLVIRLVDSPHRPPAFVMGARDAFTVLEGACAPSYLEVLLDPLAAYRLLGLPMADLSGQLVDLVELLGGDGRRLGDQLRQAPGWRRRFALLDRFLLERLARGPRPSPEVARAWGRLVASGGAVPIARLASEVGWSHRHLIARFREQVGLRPKTAARLVRFDGVWRRLDQAGGRPDWGLLAPVAVGAVGIAGARGEVYTPRGPGAPSAPVDEVAAPAHAPGKPTAVILLGPEGANAADVLAPYEVLASTGAFNLYTVAPQRQPVPLTGNLDLVPDLSLGQLDQRLPGGPEVIVVPQLTEVAAGVPPSLGPVIAWLRRQRAQGDRLLVSVCVGAQVVAEAGLLEGRPVTAHWLGLIGLRRNYPQLDWTDGVSYVDDGDLISTAGVLYGVDGALRVIERLVGPAAAAQAARAVAWPAYHPGRATPIRRFQPAPADVVGLLSAGYRWDRPTMGVLLTDGVTETELASAFRPYTELSYLARPVAVTTDGRPVRSRHGLTFIPRADLTGVAPGLDRLVVPGAAAARRGVADGLALPQRLRPVYLHRQSGFAFDAALADIAGTRDVATARWVAKTLQYPTDPPLSGPAWPWTLTLRPILLAAAAIAAVLGVRFLSRRRRRRAQPADTSSDVEPSSQPTGRRS